MGLVLGFVRVWFHEWAFNADHVCPVMPTSVHRLLKRDGMGGLGFSMPLQKEKFFVYHLRCRKSNVVLIMHLDWAILCSRSLMGFIFSISNLVPEVMKNKGACTLSEWFENFKNYKTKMLFPFKINHFLHSLSMTKY